jgi:small-conductance mechanosensitive channel
MADEPLIGGLRALWQTQPTEGQSMSVDEVRDRSRKLQENARRRLAIMYAAAVGNTAVPLVFMWYAPQLRLALAWLVVTAISMTLFVRRRSVLRTIAPALTPAEGLTFYRRLLEHERDFHRDSTRWFTIGPAVNILMLGGVYATSPLFRGTAPEIAILTVIAATHVVVLAIVARRLRGLADKNQMELDQLAALTA